MREYTIDYNNQQNKEKQSFVNNRITITFHYSHRNILEDIYIKTDAVAGRFFKFLTVLYIDVWRKCFLFNAGCSAPEESVCPVRRPLPPALCISGPLILHVSFQQLQPSPEDTGLSSRSLIWSGKSYVSTSDSCEVKQPPI